MHRNVQRKTTVERQWKAKAFAETEPVGQGQYIHRDCPEKKSQGISREAVQW